MKKIFIRIALKMLKKEINKKGFLTYPELESYGIVKIEKTGEDSYII